MAQQQSSSSCCEPTATSSLTAQQTATLGSETAEPVGDNMQKRKVLQQILHRTQSTLSHYPETITDASKFIKDVRQADIDNQSSQNTTTASADRLTTLHITHTNRPKIAGTRPSSMQFKKILLSWPNEQISERTDQNVTQSIQ